MNITVQIALIFNLLGSGSFCHYPYFLVEPAEFKDIFSTI